MRTFAYILESLAKTVIIHVQISVNSIEFLHSYSNVSCLRVGGSWVVFFIFGPTVVIVGLDDAFRLEKSGYDKWKTLKHFKWSVALCCTPAVPPDVSDRFTGWSFEVLLLCLFSRNLARLQSVFIFYKLSSGHLLHLESFENNLFEFVSLN